MANTVRTTLRALLPPYARPEIQGHWRPRRLRVEISALAICLLALSMWFSPVGASAFTTQGTHGQGQGQGSVATSRVVSTQRSAEAPAALLPRSILQYCLGTTILGVSNTPGNWSTDGHAVNSCPVAMQTGLISLTSQINCPYGTSSSLGSIDFPSPWNAGYGFDWSVTGTADCFSCTDGIMTGVPPYSETVTASLAGTGTNNVRYQSEPPPAQVTIPMKQFRPNTPC